MSKQCFLRAFKDANYCPDSGLYKHEFWDAKANTHHLELLTSEEYDKLCDEREAAEEKLEAERLKAQRKREAEQEEHLRCWTEYRTKCVETAKGLTEDQLNGWVTTGLSESPESELQVFRAYVGPKVKIFAPKSLNWAFENDSFVEKEVCLVASTHSIRHVPAFGGDGYFYNWEIIDADFVNSLCPRGSHHFYVFDSY